MRSKLPLIALGAALAVLFVPVALPTGPTSGLDASDFLQSGQFFLAAGIVLLGGLLTAMTPCVYPLIPITVSVFGARGASSKGRALALTTAYVMGMAVVFSALGTLAATTGQAFGAALGHPAVGIGLALFLLVLASSMFGAFDLNLPQPLVQRLSQVGGGGLAGAFLMGSVAGFLAAPCTGPVLTGLLAFVAQSQSPALGASFLFLYAWGIGIPFLLIGVFAVHLPKSGAWMELVKEVLGVVLVAMALGYVNDALPALREALETVGATLGRWPGAVFAAAVAFVGVAMGAFHRSFRGGEAALKVSGIALLVGALFLRTLVMDAPPSGRLWASLGLTEAPVESFVWTHHFVSEGAASTDEAVAETLRPFDEAMRQARREGKPVLIDFFAEWCTACKELDRYTYPDPKVVEASSRFVRIKVDGTQDDASIRKLYERFGVRGLPTVAFITSEGELLEKPKITGFVQANAMAKTLQRVQ